jgi:4-amino-4-deoxy-L-arabinose transferase-like glycosyltransferase
MVPLFAGLVLVVKDRGAKWFGAARPLPGLLWALLLVVPWFVLIMIATKGAFLADSVGNDMLGKVGSGQESHGAPPGTYFVAFWATAWPMAPFAALAAAFAWTARREKAVAFLLAWIVPFWLVFEAVPTKLPHYVLPAFPAIAILILLTFERSALVAQTIWARVLLRLVPAIPLLLLMAGLGLSVWSGRLPGIFAVLAVPFLVWLAWHLLRAINPQKIETSVLAAFALAVSAYVFVFSGIMTSGPFEAWRMSPRLADAARLAMSTQSQCARYSAVTVGFNEPSLVFLTGTDLLMTGGEEAARFVQGGPCRVAFVDARGEAAFKSALSASSNISLISRVGGLNLNGGRKLDMGVYAVKVSAP